MALAHATYGGGGYQTDVSNQGASVGGGAGIPKFLLDLAKRRAIAQAKQDKLDLALKAEALKQTKKAGNVRDPRPTLRDTARANAETQAATDAARAASAQARALTERAPLRTSWIMGAGGHLTNDINKMTGAQRQVFLPQGAGFEGPSLSEMDAGRQAMSIADMARLESAGQGRTTAFGGAPTQYGLSLLDPGDEEAGFRRSLRMNIPSLFFGRRQDEREA